MKLMREPIEYGCAAGFHGSFERRFDSCKIIQQME
jgi:hypothetical protein